MVSWEKRIAFLSSVEFCGSIVTKDDSVLLKDVE